VMTDPNVANGMDDRRRWPHISESLVPDLPVPLGTLQRLQPEARLALAVLEDAIETLQATYGVRSLRARVLAQHTWSWITRSESTNPFAFRLICQHLDLDAAWLRKGLEQWRPVRTKPSDSSVRRARRR
jgi:hypothetical protein